MLGKIVQKICEDLDWNYVQQRDGTVELSKESNAGEDFVMTFSKPESRRDLSEKIFNYYYDFDVDEHVKELMNASGAPGLSRLIDDAREIKKDIFILSQALLAGKVEKDDGCKAPIPMHDNLEIHCRKNKTHGWYLTASSSGVVIYSESFLSNRDELRNCLEKAMKKYIRLKV